MDSVHLSKRSMFVENGLGVMVSGENVKTTISMMGNV
jgi:hypothetical protein